MEGIEPSISVDNFVDYWVWLMLLHLLVVYWCLLDCTKIHR